MSDTDIYQRLVRNAFAMTKHSYAPYSHFCVGASLLGDDGKFYDGCNIENAAYGPSVCAERVAVFKAVSSGVKKIKAIAIVGGKEGQNTDTYDFCPPCGVCRQVLSEFADNGCKIILADGQNNIKIFDLEELLPLRFQLADNK